MSGEREGILSEPTDAGLLGRLRHKNHKFKVNLGCEESRASLGNLGSPLSQNKNVKRQRCVRGNVGQ